MPGADCTRSSACKNESTQISPPQVHRTSRHSLRDGVTVSFVLSPAIGLFVTVVSAMHKTLSLT